MVELLPVHRYSVDIFHILGLQLLINLQMIKKTSVLFHFKMDHYETGFNLNGVSVLYKVYLFRTCIISLAVIISIFFFFFFFLLYFKSFHTYDNFNCHMS